MRRDEMGCDEMGWVQEDAVAAVVRMALQVIWYGIVRYGMVWYGMVWYGIV